MRISYSHSTLAVAFSIAETEQYFSMESLIACSTAFSGISPLKI